MKIGTEDKKKVILVAVMFAIIVPAAIVEIYQNFSSPAPPRAVPAATATRPAAPARTSAAPAASTAGRAAAANTTAPEAQRVAGLVVDPTLHMEKLAQSEEVEYEGTGRNIFSAQSAPVPQPIAPGRPGGNDTATVTTSPPPPPKQEAPTIDLKYFGYQQGRDKAFRAFLLHGDDIFMARPGDVVDHRYKVGVISANSIQITDLAYNNTQSVPFTSN